MIKNLLKSFLGLISIFATVGAFAQVPVLNYTGSPYTLPTGTLISPINPNTANPVGAYGAIANAFNLSTNGGSNTYTVVGSVVTFDPVSNAFYAVDYNNGWINKITTAGVVSVINTPALSYNSGSSIVVDGLGNLYVSDAVAQTVIEIALSNPTVVKNTFTGFTSPSGLALDANNNVYVVDAGNGTNSNGKIFKITAGATTAISYITGFSNPYGIAISGTDIYLTQYGSTTPLKNIIKLSGAVTSNTPAPAQTVVFANTTATAPFNTPHNLTFDANGNLFVADYGNGTVDRITPGGAESTVLSTGLTSPGQVTFDASGVIYIGNMTRAIKQSTVTYYTITAGTIPPGLTFNTVTGVITGTPTTTGPYSITVTAKNSAGTSIAQTLNFVITLPAPTVSYAATTPAPPYTFYQGITLPATVIPTSTNVKAAGGFAIVPSITGLGLSFDSNTGAITGTPTTTSASQPYIVTVTSTGGLTGTTSFTLAVILPPAPTALSYTPATGGGLFYTQNVAITNEVANVTGVYPSTGAFSIKNNTTGTTGAAALPSGLTFDVNTGLISGTPTVAQVANSFTVTVTNAGGSIGTTFNLTVYPKPPTIAYTGSPFTYGVGTIITSLTPTVTGSPTSYTISPNLNTNTGLTFDPTTGIISGTPTKASAAVTYTISAYNANPTPGTATISITVVPPPTISYTGSPYNYVVGTAITSLTPAVTNGPTSYSISPNLTTNTGLVFSTTTGVISGNPTTASGPVTYTITATNASGSGSTNISIQVYPKPPTIAYTGSPFTYGIGTTITSLTPTVTGSPTSYTISPNLNTNTGLTFDPITGIISGTPTTASAAVTYTISAYNVNPTPGTTTISIMVVLPPTISYTGSPYTYVVGTAITSLTPTVTNGPTSYSISPSLTTNTGLAFSTTTGVISGNPTTASGPVTYTVTATNASGSGSTNISIQVYPKSPTIAYTGSPFTYGINVSITTLTPAVTGSPTNYTISPNLTTNTGLSFDPSTGIISGTPTTASAAVTYTISAYNINPTPGTTTISITIVNKPTIAYTGSPFTYTVGTAITSLTPAVTNSPTSYSVSPNLNTNTGLTFNTSTGVISGTPTVIATAVTYTVTATNVAGSGSTTISITINPKKPIISYTPATYTYIVNTPISTVTPTVSGTGGLPVSYTLVEGSLSAGLSFNNTNGQITGTPTAVLTPAVIYHIYATNAGGNSTTVTVTINVNQQTPVISYNTPNVYLVGGTVNLAPTTSLPAVPATYTISAPLPSGVSISPSTGLISGTPTQAMSATVYTVTANTGTSSGTTTVSIQVNDVAPTTFSYPAHPDYQVGTAIANLTPTITGGNIPTRITYSGFNAPWGMAIDPTGQLYVVNNGNTTISVYSSTGTLVRTISPGGGTISGIVFDAAGNYYLQRLSGNVTKFTSGDVSLGNITTSPNSGYGIDIDGSGNIYTADQYGTGGNNSGIWKYNVSTGTSSRIITYGNTGIIWPDNVNVDAAGNIYIVDRNTKQLLKYSSAGVYVSTIATGLNDPYGFTMDAAGNFYVGDSGVSSVKVLSSTGVLLNTLYGVTSPRGIVTDTQGNIYVSDFTNNTVTKFPPKGGFQVTGTIPPGITFDSSTGIFSGTPIAPFGPVTYTVYCNNSGGSTSTTVTLKCVVVAPVIAYNPVVNNYTVNVAITPLTPANTGGPIAKVGFSAGSTFATGTNPWGMTIDGSGNVFVANYSASTIVKYNSSGGVVSTFNIASNPTGVATDGSGTLFVSTVNGSIYRISSGGVITTLTQTILNNGNGGNALGIAINPAKTILYFTDQVEGIVYKYTISTGATATYLPYPSPGIYDPTGITTDASGNTFIADFTKKTVSKYTAAGAFSSTILSGLGTPYGLYTDPSGYIYVADSDTKTVSFYNAAGQYQNSVGGFTDPRGTVVDGSGNLYVSDYSTGKITKFPIASYYAISPGLPGGLVFDKTTGTISGTPTVASPATTYQIIGYGYNATSDTTEVTISCAVSFDWVGSGSWSTPANWLSLTVPTATDVANIGVNKPFTSIPIVTANTSVGGVLFGTNGGKAPGLSVNTGFTLNVVNAITLQSDINSYQAYNTATLAGAGTITVSNIKVIANTTLSGQPYAETLSSSSAALKITNNIALTSSVVGSDAFNATFTVTGGMTSLPGTFISTNTSGSTSTIGVSGGTLRLSNSAPLSSLSSAGINVVNFNGAGGVVEYAGAAQTIYTDAVTPNVSNPISYTGLTFSGTGVKTLTSGNLNIGGDYTNNLANDAANYVTLSNTPVFFNGTVAQALAGGAGKGTVFNNVTFSGASTKTMTSGLFSVLSSGLLTMSGSSSSTVLNAGGFLTLISDVNGSATVPAFTGPSITGNVTVQRYVTGGAGYRGYRLVSSPVSVSNAGVNKVISVGYPITNVYLKGTTGTAGGFDDGGNPNLYLFRENLVPSNTSFTSGNFRAVNNITTPGSYSLDGESGAFNIPVGNGFMMFYRGSRKADTKANEYVTTYVPQADTLNAVGLLNQGPVTVRDWFTPSSNYLSFTGVSGDATVNGFNLVGNPYASSIDWDKWDNSNNASPIYAPGVGPFIYVLDSKSSNYNVYQAGNSGNLGTIAPSGSNIIPSGQGFFVVAGSTTAALTFTEAAKTNAQATAAQGNLFMGTPPVAGVKQYMHLILSKDSIHTDGIMISFNNTAKAQYVFGEDAPYKLGNGPVSLASTSADNIGLAINTLPLPAGSQAIKLQVGAATDGTYTLALKEIASVPQIYDVWLKDAYRKDSLDIKHNPTYVFDVIKSDTNSFGGNRFSLIIRQNPLLALHLLDFTGSKITAGTQVVWKTENEQNYTNFTVERSVDNGSTFQVVGGFASTGAGTYSFIDKNPVTTTNDGYRLKLVDLNGRVTYSNIVTIQYANNSNNIARNGMNIYPNPATGTINVAISQTISTPSYGIQIVNNLGAVVRTATSPTTNWQADVSKLIPGTYIIKVINNGNKTEVGKGTFVKL